VDLSRLHRGYTIEVESKVPPPWMPDAVFDDGSKTFLHFREALTYTSGPAVFGVNQQGKVVPTASHMFVKPPTPEEPHDGAWMIVPRLYPALQLKDSSNLSLRIIRQAPATGGAREQ
jgi:type IV secretory pathway VirB9-like protein